MFGNKINYTQSPGGKRRGLIYQSSDNIGRFIDGNRIYFNYAFNGWNSIDYIEFADNSEVNLVMDSIPRVRTDIVSITGNWLPLKLYPVYKLTFDNLVLDISNFENLISATSNIKFKLENITITGYDGTSTSTPMLVVYVDITNVPIIQIGSYYYYDIPSVLGSSVKFRIGNLRYRYDILSTHDFETEGDFKYFVSRADHFDYVSTYGFRMIGLNDMVKGHMKCYWKAKPYEKTPTTNPNRYEPNFSKIYCHEIDMSSSYGILLQGNPGSTGCYNSFYFGPPCNFDLGFYNYWFVSPHERNIRISSVGYRYVSSQETLSTPSNIIGSWLTGGSIGYEMLSSWATKVATNDFEIDFTTPMNYDMSTATFDVENTYASTGGMIDLPSFDDKYISSYNP